MSSFNVYLEKIQKYKNNNYVYNESAPLGVVGQLFALVGILAVVSGSVLAFIKAVFDKKRNDANTKKIAKEILEKYKKPNGRIPAIINQDGTINEEAVKDLSAQDKRIIYREISDAIGITGEESGIGKKEQENIFKTESRLSEEGRREYLANRKKLGEDIWRRTQGIKPKKDDFFD